METMANWKSSKSQPLVTLIIEFGGMRPFSFEVRARTTDEALRKARAAYPQATKITLA